MAKSNMVTVAFKDEDLLECFYKKQFNDNEQVTFSELFDVTKAPNKFLSIAFSGINLRSEIEVSVESEDDRVNLNLTYDLDEINAIVKTDEAKFGWYLTLIKESIWNFEQMIFQIFEDAQDLAVLWGGPGDDYVKTYGLGIVFYVDGETGYIYVDYNMKLSEMNESIHLAWLKDKAERMSKVISEIQQEFVRKATKD